MSEVEFEIPANKSVKITYTRHKDEACNVKFWYLPEGQSTWLFIADVYSDKNVAHTLDENSYPALKKKDNPWQMKCESRLQIGTDYQETYPQLRPEETKATVLIMGQPGDSDTDPNTSVTFNYT